MYMEHFPSPVFKYGPFVLDNENIIGKPRDNVDILNLVKGDPYKITFKMSLIWSDSLHIVSNEGLDENSMAPP